MKKIRNKDHVYFTRGVVVFEFFGNTDEDFKIRSLHSAAKELRKQFNVSVSSFEDNLVENPERGTVALGFICLGKESAATMQEKVLEFLESHVPARISSDEFESVAL